MSCTKIDDVEGTIKLKHHHEIGILCTAIAVIRDPIPDERGTTSHAPSPLHVS
jgi:hypothetical protein